MELYLLVKLVQCLSLSKSQLTYRYEGARECHGGLEVLSQIRYYGIHV